MRSKQYLNREVKKKIWSGVSKQCLRYGPDNDPLQNYAGKTSRHIDDSVRVGEEKLRLQSGLWGYCSFWLLHAEMKMWSLKKEWAWLSYYGD